ncbi:contact-dependent growth inhibition system immunity protein [Erythrobacter litoralis]|uniref:contact-dependent growth inhibition system immunity protein n=1 Tax=Erythrobacter litoralis TaxID=39960 RepID=UPI0018C8CE34
MRLRREAENKNSTEWPAFHHLMDCYWHQTADAFYSEFKEALDDFRECEGQERFEQLKAELCALRDQGRFPRPGQLRVNYNKPFWRGYARIVTTRDIATCDPILGSRETQ